MLHKRTSLGAIIGALILIAALPAVAFGIPRDTVLARGKVWVDKKVPYSQSRYARENGSRVSTATASPANVGFRTDCSGFVSMCLNLRRSNGMPRSLDTATLPSVLATISKDALLPGDVILRSKGPSVAYGHAILFVAWADDAHTKYISYEESGGGKGSISRVVPYPFYGEKGFKPYRYKQIDDFYSDVEDAINGSTPYKTAAQAERLAFPSKATVPALVITNSDEWTGNIAAAALTSAAGGPVLLTAKDSLPASTVAEIQRLKPSRIYLIGGPAQISASVATKIAKLTEHVTRIAAPSRYALAVKAATSTVKMLKSRGHRIDTAYIVGRDAFSDAVAIAPVSARTGRPVFISRQDTATKTTLAGLKAARIKHVIIVGGAGVVGPKVVAELKKARLSVARLAGKNLYETALQVAKHGAALHVGLSWTHLGVSSGTSQEGMLACAVSQGQTGSLVLFTTGDKLHEATAELISAQASAAGKVRVFGSFDVVKTPVRASIAKYLRAAK